MSWVMMQFTAKENVRPGCIVSMSVCLNYFMIKLSKSDDPYYCPNCASARHSREISDLRKQVKALTDALVGMKALES